MSPGLQKKACPCLPLATFIYPLNHPSPTALSNVLLFSGVQPRRRWTQVAQRVRDGGCDLGIADSYPFAGLGLGVDT